ncbi:MAG: PAS domain S-box protein, partial [Bacteroidia bacterium]|nr:PAS domain S-box protein [Bacteroidia bacterium]
DDENYWRWQAWDKDGDFVDLENYPGAQALRGETVVPGMEMLFTRTDGSKTWTRVSAVPVKSSGERIIGTVSVITDIDELKRTAEALIKSSQQLALSLEAAKMGIFEWNSDDKNLRLSQSSEEIYGLYEHQAILSNEEAYKLVHFEDIEMRRSVFERPGVLAAYYHEYRIIRPVDGKMAWIAEKGKAYRDSFTGITTIRGVHWDITEKKKIEEALRSSERNLKELNENLEQQVQKRTKELMKLKMDQEKEKLNAIIFTQEQERARISEGLHDGVAQLLYAIQNRLQMVKYPGAKDDKELKLIKEILTEAIEDTRKISFELMPPVLKDYGLEVCLSNLIKKVVGDRVKLNWDVSIVGRLPEQLEITIYRIVQEILNNILKHAKATEAGLSVKVSDRYIRLKAYDNGIGFSVKNIKKEYHGIGLQSIRNRVKLLNGKMQIISSPGEGTIIELQLPLKQK